MEKHTYLRKANDDVVSHCRCDKSEALISSPAQMDCPWCGCGWLFLCGRCQKAFTFAEGIEVNETWEETADRTLKALYGREPKPSEVDGWIEFMKILLKDVQQGHHYVYLDGWVISTAAETVAIEGWHSYHQLNFIPQTKGNDDQEAGIGLLGSRDYWLSNQVPGQDP